ncbi:uncharacterized protein [Paramormyrops kingsleyae]|uniref:uncharacterized protein isoform X1 n=1 Tax=Paramormyrops kingsleyae TaxID=1676925 RepID=UPI003B96C623
MASLVLIFFLLLQISRFSDSMPTINLNCSSLRDGDRYRIQTEATVGMNITLCLQEWNRGEQNEYPVAYYPKRDFDIYPPVVEVTAQEIWLEKCANLTLTLHCHQVTKFRFSVNLDDRQEEKTTRGFINDRQEEKTTRGSIAAVVVVVIGVFTVLLVLIVKYRHRVMRLCGDESVIGHQGNQLQGGAEAGDSILQQDNVLHLVPQIPGQVSNTQGQVTQQLLQLSQDLPDGDHHGLQVGGEGHHLEQPVAAVLQDQETCC